MIILEFLLGTLFFVLVLLLLIGLLFIAFYLAFPRSTETFMNRLDKEWEKKIKEG